MIAVKEVRKPIEPYLQEFDAYFKSTMKTHVSLLNIIIKYIIKQRGKQIRPTLVFLSAAMCGEVSQRTFIGAAMVELLHTATLVHDDVVDDSAERRGVASINALWKNKVAILVGDFLLSRGLLIAVENDEFAYLKATSTAVKRMSEGELLQIEKSRELNLDEETYFKIISDKTASLTSTCCMIGSLSATDNVEFHKALQQYGEYVGIAFQIRDDILDYTSRSAILGKPIANDIKEKKLTLPLIYAASVAPKDKAKEIISIVKKGKATSDSIQKVFRFVDDYGGIEYATNKANQLSNDAKQLLTIFPDSPAKTALLQFADFVSNRQS